MNKPDNWGDAVNGRPEPRLPDPGQREGPIEKKDDPAWERAGAITMAVCTISVVITLCLLVLRWGGII